ncbi:MAG: M15 family metallopeptidase [Thermoleophilia bacterium]|nr:M15 family metallopeptidase [Thermoleophilia bacterium]
MRSVGPSVYRPAVGAALVLLVAASAAGPGTEDAGGAQPTTFRANVTKLTPAQRDAMTPSVWRPGCPVHIRALRRVTVVFWGFGGRTRKGAIVVHRDVAGDLVTIFRRLYRSRIAVRKMRPIERFGGSDLRSIEADNTSAFNCRFVEGTRRWSQHAYGRAIDINPLENPYVRNGRTSHRRSVPFVRRRPYRKGMAVPGGAMVAAFGAVGWGWGGRWRTVKDYQHFSASSR